MDICISQNSINLLMRTTNARTYVLALWTWKEQEVSYITQGFGRKPSEQTWLPGSFRYGIQNKQHRFWARRGWLKNTKLSHKK